MSCLKPILLKNPRYKKQSKEEFDEYRKNVIGEHNLVFNDNPYIGSIGFKPPDYYIKVPCGKCLECKKKKRLSWSLRLMHECRSHKESTFLTLTLDNEYLVEFKDDPKRPLKLYIDRLRKHLGYRPKYFFVNEYGEENDRLHYHGVIFGTDKEKLPFDLLRGKWPYGISWLGSFCNYKTANYITKYMLKYSGDKKPFIMCSNGIGESYVTKPGCLEKHLNNFDYRPYVHENNAFYPLPKYYVDKLFTDELKVCLMLNRTKQDKYYLRGKEYRSEYEYLKARDRWYKDTLRLGMSDSLKTRYYGKFYISETGDSKTELFDSGFVGSKEPDVCAGLFDSSVDEGYSPRR